MKFLILSLLLILSMNSYADDSHSAIKKEENPAGHDHEDSHVEEENNFVGSDKGILSASEQEGFQLSPQAEKNFEIQLQKVRPNQPLEIPKSALISIGTEVQLYRYRDGHYKRIEFELVRKTTKQVLLRSKDLKYGDQIVVQGMGFLRIAEIAAFGGAPEGHSH